MDQNYLNKLIEPRAIQLVKYPGQSFPKGTIHQCGPEEGHSYNKPLSWFKEFPDVYRILDWWEFRKPDELPIYLKQFWCIQSERQIITPPTTYHKVLKYHIDDPEGYNSNHPFALDINYESVYLSMSLPCTKEEYEENLELSKSSF